jgi:prolyl 4-hydroxylase
MGGIVFSGKKVKRPPPSPQVSILCQDPLVRVFDNFISKKECQWIIEKATPRMKRAVVSAADKGVESPGRTGSVAWFSHENDPVIDGLTSRIADLAELPLVNSEPLQVQG